MSGHGTPPLFAGPRIRPSSRDPQTGAPPESSQAPPLPEDVSAGSVSTIDWDAVSNDLDREGVAVLPPLLDRATCASLRETFDDHARFRSTINMARYNFGEGQYRYFARPLPNLVARLRAALYPPLAQIANTWAQRLGSADDWPDTLEGLTDRCRAAGQLRPTPLLLKYQPGDYNCLHQDLYGEVHFPLQVVFLLSDPGTDFDGGELVVVEQRPRLQSRPMVIPLAQGGGAIIPVRERPRASTRGWSRSQMRHGVSRVRRGERFTLGIIFHDAA